MSTSAILRATAVLWPLVLVAWLASVLVPLDVGLGDGGFILSFTERVIHGQTPHSDFISPRPAGSAYVHLLDHALPLPLLVSSRLIAIAEVVAYSICLGLLLLDRRLAEVGLPAACLLVGVVLVDFHVFPPLPWHTIDGALFAAAGFLALERALRRPSPVRLAPLVVACLLLGTAPLMKQSFAAAPLLGLLRLVAPMVAARAVDARTLVAAVGALALPGIAYTLLVAADGGLDEMLTELTSARPVHGEPLFDVLKSTAPERGSLLALLAGGAALYGVAFWSDLAAGRHARVVGLAARAVLTLLVLKVALSGGLEFEGAWQFRLFWLAVVITAMSSIARRALDWPAIVVVAMAWMVTLSWGAARPAFMAGALAAVVLVRAWAGAGPALRSEGMRALAACTALIAAAVVVWNFWDIRSHTVFLPQRPARLLSEDLREVSPALRGIRSDPATAGYLRAAGGCAHAFPARWTAILPEDAFTSSVLKFRNPFPMDWLWPDEYGTPGSRERIVAAAQRLAREGNYLVLAPLIPQAALSGNPTPELPTATTTDPIPAFPFDAALGEAIFSALDGGEHIACGPFVGRYAR